MEISTMTVGELINKLEGFDRDKKVIFCDTDEGQHKGINGVEERDGDDRVFIYDWLMTPFEELEKGD